MNIAQEKVECQVCFVHSQFSVFGTTTLELP